MRFMPRWLFLCGLSAVGGIVLGFRRGVRIGKRNTQGNPYALISHRNIQELVSRLDARSDHHTYLSLNTLPHHGAPDADQWLSLLEHDQPTAHRLIEQLYQRLYQTGMQVESAVANSIEAYHATQVFLYTAPKTVSPKPSSEQHYPSKAEWQRLSEENFQQAQSKAALLELQQARFGLNTPIEIQESLQAFYEVIKSRATLKSRSPDS